MSQAIDPIHDAWHTASLSLLAFFETFHRTLNTKHNFQTLSFQTLPLSPCHRSLGGLHRVASLLCYIIPPIKYTLPTRCGKNVFNLGFSSWVAPSQSWPYLLINNSVQACCYEVLPFDLWLPLIMVPKPLDHWSLEVNLRLRIPPSLSSSTLKHEKWGEVGFQMGA